MTKKEYKLIVDNINKKKWTMFSKRLFDLLASFTLLIILLPLILIILLLILFDSGKPVFFRQERIGKAGKNFKIFKFRTMKRYTAKEDGITLANDARITKIGMFLRRYRLDEIPQLFNIIKGEMSFVGPRPDLSKYYVTNDYAHMCVLLIKPGVTGNATLKFKDEDKILAQSENPEKTYKEEIFPEKIRLNIEYIKQLSISYDLKIIFRTIIETFIK